MLIADFFHKKSLSYLHLQSSLLIEFWRCFNVFFCPDCRYSKEVKKASFLPMIATVLVVLGVTPETVWARALGEPGCLAQIQGRIVTDQQAKLLSPVCREFRTRYLAGLQALSRDSEKMFNGLASEISAAKGATPPYTALLLAVLSQESRSPKDQPLLQAIEKRAAIEARLKVPFRYGAAAIERLKNSECKNFHDPFYAEICERSDPVYRRVVALGESKEMKR
jgi:hypothetical protein